MQIEWERDGSPDDRPVYRQIGEAIVRAIEEQQLEAGSRLPAIRLLAGQLGVNRDTVALAYESLAADGIVESAVGRGTFVADNAVTGRTPCEAAPFRPALPAPVERLLELERARPHFGTGPDAVPMHSLIPDPSLYPADAFRRALNRAMNRGGPEILLYGTPEGDVGLREALAKRLTRAALPVDADDLVLCHGASQGISLALRLFCAPDDVLAVEEPTYNNVLGAAFGQGLQTTPIPMQPAGLDLGVLDRSLARPEVKALYTIPTFHNPLGTTTGLAHRRALLEIARRHGVPVIEDGYEMDLRFAGRPLPPLAGLDTSGLVVHLFSFSKSLFPGARVGAITVRGRQREALLALKQSTDLSDSLPLQKALAEFVAAGEYDRHLARVHRVLRSRSEALIQALADLMPRGTTWTSPDGGYQVWVELPGGLDTRDLLTDAVGAGVLFAPGSQFFADGRASNALRLTFAMADEQALRRGVERLAQVVVRHLEGEAPIAARPPV